ncbi:aliphatic sulfonate ABC transporter substrate-binding protein [Rhodomicrobium udaipurense]|uniref:Putative aliphatic sulfonates-binding protein n=1 Tax=Rhodomicrobium udaipurense TaxID=1202716 RepID=A0A8I1GDD7_9HYPH|nr:aliphatic sulfonate ABC transporter substrate-binding protein [Rhodomicrobium udaipurense]MBJ7542884.1 aliphatic sulfonate ABC transporter substrate-binding protein [Rhodomicrobium udaipurense]
MHFLRSLLLAASCVVFGWQAPAAAEDKPDTVRIGFQKSSTLITVLKTQGKLDAALQKIGVSVKWNEFTSGPPMLEALNIGAIDLTADVADTVPIFAQAAGANMIYVAQEAPSPTAQAILIPAASELKSPAELKGKRVALTKGTGGHYLLLATLAKAGLTFKDIQPVYLGQADCRAAFERGSVDAWVTWDPYLSAGEIQAGARVLADGKDVALYQRYYLASTAFATARPDVLAVIFDELHAAGKWVKDNPQAAAELLKPIWGLDTKIIEQANGRRSYDVRLPTTNNLVDQQIIADTFFKEQLLPKAVDVKSAKIWHRGS